MKLGIQIFHQNVRCLGRYVVMLLAGAWESCWSGEDLLCAGPEGGETAVCGWKMMVANLICCACVGTIRVNVVKQGLGIDYVVILLIPPIVTIHVAILSWSMLALQEATFSCWSDLHFQLILESTRRACHLMLNGPATWTCFCWLDEGTRSVSEWRIELKVAVEDRICHQNWLESL